MPGYTGVLLRLLALLPQPGKDFLHRRAVPNQIEAADRAARADYEARRLP